MGHKHIEHFNPDVMLLEQAHQDFSTQLNKFNAGKENLTFTDFISKDAEEYRDDGNGASYVVWNVYFDEDGEESYREVVAYYTLAATAIPYEDRIRLDGEDLIEGGPLYDSQICGIPALEIKMFALDEKYQDLFYEYEGEDLPISAWIMRNIISYANYLMHNIIGFKAIFLHSVPEAEEFYKSNGFNPIEIYMQPLQCIDSEFTAMYLTLREVHINYEK
ncbi:MAG: hypothetical protein J6A59_00945 [Lachnospiraceae bacterium]|nr:hypothetical protein [Lachnospiraceae bacterium]